eukprot:CAMPEP_0174823546 /NCGR_PEP_ID=MMETSP1107-20130205/25740_1 /TAXON_ID=36770 /ORGANISM="Paraphysomonas vestita, Strain GFlagA" /LENGTH=39 /DNA_ID= /DNA_START= /DNA_END= /DNA_ORIENTATION=
MRFIKVSLMMLMVVLFLKKKDQKEANLMNIAQIELMLKD